MVLDAELPVKVVVIDAPPFTVSDVSEPLGAVETPLVISRTNTPPIVRSVHTVASVMVLSTVNV